MATNPLFNILPFNVNNANLPVIPTADIKRLGAKEFDAYAHWEFGGDASSLIDVVNGRTLTAQSDGITYPNTSYLNMSMAPGKGLLSPLGEVSAQTDTAAAVIRLNGLSGVARQVIGSLGTSTGGGLFVSSGPIFANNHRGLSNFDQAIGVNAPTDTWVFVSLSRDFASATKSIRILVGGSALFEGTPTGTYAQTAGKIGLGNTYLTTANTQTQDVSEFLLFDRALSATELNDLYARAKTRAAARGISIV